MTGIEYHLNGLLMGYRGTRDKTVTHENSLKEARSLYESIASETVPYCLGHRSSFPGYHVARACSLSHFKHDLL